MKFKLSNLELITAFITIIFISMLNASVFSQTKKYTISGVVTDNQGSPLAGVNVFINNSKIGTTTNNSGKYSLTFKRIPGKTLLYQFIGYKPVTKNINFAGKYSLVINVEMEQDVLSMEEVEIIEKKVEQNVGVYELKAADMKIIPGFYADALSAVKTLPGVASNNEMSNTFHVHGGSANDNLILLEGIRLPQPRQIRNSYQEGMSQINPALVENFHLLTGGFSARYGEKLHSVLLTDYHQSVKKNFQGELELSLINAGLTLEGKLPNNGYWALAGRWADTGTILNTLQTRGQYHPRYHDFQAIGRIPFSQNHKLNFMALFLKNDFELIPNNHVAHYGTGFLFYNEFRTEFDGKEQALFQSDIVAANLESRLSSNFSMKNYFIYNSNKENDKVDLTGETYLRLDIEYGTDEPDSVAFISRQFDYKNNFLKENSYTYKNELNFTLPNHALLFGCLLNHTKLENNLEEKFYIFVNANEDTVESREERSDYKNSESIFHNSFALFAEDTWQITPSLSSNIGIRGHYFSYNHTWTINPRLNFKWSKSTQTWYAFSLGRFAQPPEYRELIGEDHQILSNVQSQIANQAAISYFHQNENQTETRIEAFYIDHERLIPYDFTDIYIQYQPEYHATGKTYGINFYRYGKLNKRLNSWFSYNYIVARQNIKEFDRDFPSPTDQRHTISVVLQDDMPEIPWMQTHLRLLFGSGYPYTAYTSKLDEETGIYYPEPYRRLGFRMAYYRRIDVGMSYKRILTDRYQIKVMFEIFNVFDFRNVLSYKYIILQDGTWKWVRNNLSRRIYNFRINFNF